MSTKFEGDLSKACRDISLKTPNVNLVVGGKVNVKRIHHLLNNDCLYKPSLQPIKYLSKHFSQSQKCQPASGARGNVGTIKVTRLHRLSVPNLMAIHQVLFEIFQSRPKWWTDRQTDIAIPRAVLLAWLKISVSSTLSGCQ